MTVTVNPNTIGACSVKKIVVLGSSTAYGTGASPSSNSWVNRYANYLQQLNASNSVVNLAVWGYSTYQLMPTTSLPPVGRPVPDTLHNITAAITQNPDAIIVNLPSNDIVAGYTVSEIESNYQTIKDAATQANVPIWFTTTQPRTANMNAAGQSNQMLLRDWITSTFAPRSVDFWTTLANADGTISSSYAAGDGVHVNNLGHQKLYNRVAGSNLIETLCATPTPTPTP
jgi:lysophospholipase L1-like esterase